ncbi:fungal specific transcription factor domain protein [Rhizoctonia solani AG-3 Rhs1AP]|uniref:Fungal specific transcription factor domain protein n=2 Tax=Rhizoctonia solani AG-3 TaxID=1086053 RepID=X8J0M4_9AGAM|nr:fungal specific transcription factor domain protein [Rhizoctonia solani AG-3 Rhs1AP]
MRLLLVVCAVGARWCKDPRVLDDQWSSELSAGYRWFRSAYKGGINVLYRPSLVNIQFTVLSVVFLLGTSFDDMTWFFAAKASRMFEALGSHRRKQSRTLADELMKRAFRCHFILDCFTSTTVGKPSALQNIDVDVDDVMEIDDLQWTPDLHALPPPPQRSSLQLAALNHAYRLCITIDQALQTVYAPTSVKRQIGLGSSQGEEWIARSLNQQLNRWAAPIPGNLRLPDQEDFTKCPIPHLYSTVTLWTGYCYAAICINRPFITSKVPEISTTSFHNCRQAARQRAKMIQAYYEVPTALPLQFAIAGVFSSAMILLIDSIANSPTGRPREDTTLDSQGYSAVANERHLRICSATLERLEKYYHIAGRLNDIIKEFQDFWTSRLAAQPTGTQPLKSLDSYDPCTASSFTLKNLESPALSQPPPGVSTLAWKQSTSPYLTTQTPGLFEMGIPSLSFSQTQTISHLTSISNELHSSPHDSGVLSEEWMLNIDKILFPGGIVYDLDSSPAEPGK